MTQPSWLPSRGPLDQPSWWPWKKPEPTLKYVTQPELENLKRIYGSVNAAEIAGIIDYNANSPTKYEWGPGPGLYQGPPTAGTGVVKPTVFTAAEEKADPEGAAAFKAYTAMEAAKITTTPPAVAGQDIPTTRDRDTFIRELSQSLVASGRYDTVSAISAARETWDNMYPEVATPQGQAAPAWSGTREAWEMQEAAGMQRWGAEQEAEKQRWAGEMEYNQQLKAAQERLANLRAQLDAEVGITPYRVSTEGGYMAGFGPGGMGERFGIPPVKPAYVDIGSLVSQMQGVQMPQTDWRKYIYGGY